MPNTAVSIVARNRDDLLQDWRATFRALHLYAIEPAPRLALGNGAWLRPDFYLPRSHQYVLVRESHSRADSWLVYAAARRLQKRAFCDPETTPDFPIVLACQMGELCGSEIPRVESDPRTLGLGQCAKCFGWWFLDTCASWRCQCCGYYDGDRTFDRSFFDRIEPFPLFAEAV